MVFRKREELTFKPSLRKGFCLSIREKTLVKENKKDTQKPYVRLTKETHQLIIDVRFLRPRESERPEIEKCAYCEPNHRYAIFITVFSFM